MEQKDEELYINSFEMNYNFSIQISIGPRVSLSQKICFPLGPGNTSFANNVCSTTSSQLWRKNSTFHHSGALEKFSLILCVLIWFCVFFGNFSCLHGDNIWSNLEVECFLKKYPGLLKTQKWGNIVLWNVHIWNCSAAAAVQIANCMNYQIKFCPSSLAT